MASLLFRKIKCHSEIIRFTLEEVLKKVWRSGIKKIWGGDECFWRAEKRDIGSCECYDLFTTVTVIQDNWGNKCKITNTI